MDGLEPSFPLPATHGSIFGAPTHRHKYRGPRVYNSMTDSLPYFAQQVIKNRGVGRAGERQYRFVEGLKGSQVTRTGRGSDFAVKGLFASTPRLVEVKTGNARLSPLQRATAPQVVRYTPFTNSAIATGVGVAGGVAVAEGVKYLVKKYVRLTCGACRYEATLDDHLCPRCGQPLSRSVEFWIGVILLAAGGIIAIMDLLTLGLNLGLNLFAGMLLGAGIDLLVDSPWVKFSHPVPALRAPG